MSELELHIISTIIKSSQKRQDDLHIELERRLIENKHLTIKCHRGCVSSYTSKSHILRHLKRIHTADRPSINGGPIVAAKRFCRSDLPDFSFKRHCLFCGMDCIMDYNTKNPSRWRQVYLCRTADRGKKTIPFKEVILEVCDARNDVLSDQVKIGVQGAVSDLHAADARYHEDCRSSFMAPRSVKSASGSVEPSTVGDEALELTVSEIRSNPSRIWNSLELHNMYLSHGGVNRLDGHLKKTFSKLWFRSVGSFRCGCCFFSFVTR